MVTGMAGRAVAEANGRTRLVRNVSRNGWENTIANEVFLTVISTPCQSEHGSRCGYKLKWFDRVTSETLTVMTWSQYLNRRQVPMMSISNSRSFRLQKLRISHGGSEKDLLLWENVIELYRLFSGEVSPVIQSINSINSKNQAYLSELLECNCFCNVINSPNPCCLYYFVFNWFVHYSCN